MHVNRLGLPAETYPGEARAWLGNLPPVPPRGDRIKENLRATPGYDTTDVGNSPAVVHQARQTVAFVQVNGVAKDHFETKSREAKYEIEQCKALARDVANRKDCTPTERAIAKLALRIGNWSALSSCAQVLAHFPLGAAAAPALSGFALKLMYRGGMASEFGRLMDDERATIADAVLSQAGDGERSEMTSTAARLHFEVKEDIRNFKRHPQDYPRYNGLRFEQASVGIATGALITLQNLEPQPWYVELSGGHRT